MPVTPSVPPMRVLPDAPTTEMLEHYLIHIEVFTEEDILINNAPPVTLNAADPIRLAGLVALVIDVMPVTPTVLVIFEAPFTSNVP